MFNERYILQAVSTPLLSHVLREFVISLGASEMRLLGENPVLGTAAFGPNRLLQLSFEWLKCGSSLS